MSEETKKAIRHFLYNPLRQDPQELERLFVARRPLFERLYGEIVAHQPESVPQHQLIIGQRGMGKTTMLARLALEMRKNRKDFLPLSFWEEQHIEVDRLSVFWLNCLDSLADALDEIGEPALARQIDKKVDQIKSIVPEEECARVGREAFAEMNVQIKRRLVLFIDNFNLLLGRLRKHDHILRSHFTRHGAPIIIGAAITPPDDLADYDAAFYDGFKTTLLHRLSLDETKDMIIRLADEYQQPEAVENLWRELPRLSALRDLSGGNPRTSLLIYRLCAQGFSSDIYRDLEALLDETTPLFQSRFEQLSDQGQKLVARLARHWKPATAEMITELTDFPRGTVSPLLGRLEDEGIIERVQMYDPDRVEHPKQKRGAISKRVGYQLVERFFNIWIIMRSASRRDRAGIICLSRFLESIYTPDERSRFAHELSALAKLTWGQAIGARAIAETTGHSELRFKAETVLLECAKRGEGELEGLIDPESIDGKVYKRVELKQLLRNAVPASAKTRPDEFIELVIGSLSMLMPNGMSRNTIAAIEKSRPINVDEISRNLRDEQRVFAAAIGQESIEWLQKQVRNGALSAMSNRDELSQAIETSTFSGALLFLGEAAQSIDLVLAIEAYKKAVRIAENYDTWSHLAIAYQVDGRKQLAKTAFARALELGDGSAAVCANYGLLLAVDFNELAEASKWFRKAAVLDPRSELIANNLGASLWFQGGRSNALAAIKEFERAAALNFMNPKPWINMGMIHHQVLKDRISAENCFRKAISMSSNASLARTHLGFLILESGRFLEAEEQFRKAISEGESDASCWVGLGTVLADFKKQYAESEACYRKAIDIESGCHPAWKGLGLLQAVHLKQFEQAKCSFTRAAELAPKEAQYVNTLGNLEYDHFHNIELAEQHYKRALELNPADDGARHNYAFLLRDTLGEVAKAKALLDALSQPEEWKDTQALHRALFAVYDHNWGLATDAMQGAFAEIKASSFPKNTHDDWCRFSAVLLKLGLGAKLLEFLKTKGYDVSMMPWYAALEAHVAGDRQMLLNIPAEARDAAGELFDEIDKRLPLVKTVVESQVH